MNFLMTAAPLSMLMSKQRVAGDLPG